MMFKRGENIQLSKDFNSSEFECHCNTCVEQLIDDVLIEKLQLLRDKLGLPIKINSGYRCKEHNSKVGGALNSQHVLGKAADIEIAGFPIAFVPIWAGISGFTGIGVANTFTHVDVREKLTIWNYNK